MGARSPTSPANGPSPRARGSRVPRRPPDHGARSIPACAGLTGRGGPGGDAVTVHPRVRGAHRYAGWDRIQSFGPSPRARGSPAPVSGSRAVWRSIPACAGLTHPLFPRGCVPPVHPRVRGAHRVPLRCSMRRDGPSPRARGSLAPAFHASIVDGPSPRARGSRLPLLRRRCPRRSIPACAGLTVPRGRCVVVLPVHPRVRGAHRAPGRDGSRRSVHPRVRGAHRASAMSERSWCGPSPRARGSLAELDGVDDAARSIPACAGLTAAAQSARRSAPVHPRVRGAHNPPTGGRRVRGGPSPRARGSPGAAHAGPDVRRSIPACAGLTNGRRWGTNSLAVHPRVRGAHPCGYRPPSW